MNIIIKKLLLIKTFFIFLSIMLLSNNFSIKVSAEVLNESTNITVNSSFIKDNPEETILEGTGEMIITGESYPSNIQIAGYNSRDNMLFINFTLETVKSVNGGQRVTFSYYIEVFNSSSIMIGNLGTLESPIMSIGSLGSKITTVNDEKITLLNGLTEEHRVVINVVSASVGN